MDVCWFDSVPSTGLLNWIGKPMSTDRFPTAMAAPWLSCRKLAVKVEVLPTAIEAGFAVWLSTIQGSKVTKVLGSLTVSQGAVLGPSLQPHQLLVASIVPLMLSIPVPAAAKLPATRLKLM